MVPMMNVFEDLIEELKEENLLEETIIDFISDEQDIPYGEEFPEEISDSSGTAGEKPAAVPPGGVETHKKRIVEQLSALQLAEHVFTALERNHLHVTPDVFDELEAKKALHQYLQSSRGSTFADEDLRESGLATQLDSWKTALSLRDAKVAVQDLRIYCENSRPALSPHAMFALARLYLSLPYSEAVRGKFEFVVTRLFSKTDEGFRREMICGKDEAVRHLKIKYAEWGLSGGSFLPDDDPDAMMAALSFDDFANEAESASALGELVKGDFFKRLCLFKEGLNQTFFAPSVAASAIKANILIANRYLDLLTREIEDSNAGMVAKKYGAGHEALVSAACARTLDLRSIAGGEETATQSESRPEPEARPKSTRESRRNVKSTAKHGGLVSLEVNKWLLAATFLIIAASVGLYVWAEYFMDEAVPVQVKALNLDGTPHREHLSVGKISNETFYGVTAPSFADLAKEQKSEVLRGLYEHYSQKGVKRIQLMNANAQPVGFASEERSEITEP